MPSIAIPTSDLRGMTLEQLQEFASTVGVGYADLGQEALLEKLILEGTPVF